MVSSTWNAIGILLCSIHAEYIIFSHSSDLHVEGTYRILAIEACWALPSKTFMLKCLNVPLLIFRGRYQYDAWEFGAGLLVEWIFHAEYSRALLPTTLARASDPIIKTSATRAYLGRRVNTRRGVSCLS
jgi:hypothetical protein